MKKVLDWLLELFILAYIIFLYSLIFPLAMGGVRVIVAPLVVELQDWLMSLGYVQYIIFIAIGIFLSKNTLKDARADFKKKSTSISRNETEATVDIIE